MGLSNQAITVTAVYSLVMLVSVIGTWTRGAAFTAADILAYFLYVVILIMLAYDTHCLSSGRCDVWSWIRTTIYCIIPVLFLLMLLYSLATNKNEDGVITYTVSSIPLVKQEQK